MRQRLKRALLMLGLSNALALTRRRSKKDAARERRERAATSKRRSGSTPR